MGHAAVGLVALLVALTVGLAKLVWALLCGADR